MGKRVFTLSNNKGKEVNRMGGNKRIKIKIFSGPNRKMLEDEVNEFIEQKAYEVIDMELETTNGHQQQYGIEYSILLQYR